MDLWWNNKGMNEWMNCWVSVCMFCFCEEGFPVRFILYVLLCSIFLMMFTCVLFANVTGCWNIILSISSSYSPVGLLASFVTNCHSASLLFAFCLCLFIFCSQKSTCASFSNLSVFLSFPPLFYLFISKNVLAFLFFLFIRITIPGFLQYS
jgi:hypothetical protein